MSDAFMWMDKKYRVTLELLKILRFYRYPYLIFTRSDLVADEEYLQAMEPHLASIQMSLSSINRELTRQIEPGAPAPSVVAGACRPWLSTASGPRCALIRSSRFILTGTIRTRTLIAPNLSNPSTSFSWEMLEVIAQHKVPTVVVGMVRLYQFNLRFMRQALGYDLRSHFADDVRRERASLHFAAETAYYYTRIRELCAKYGLRFSTCYIGNDATGESFQRYQPSGVTAPIVVMRSATCRPFRPRVPRCRSPPSYRSPRLPPGAASPPGWSARA